MKFFVDTADVKDIRELNDLGLLDGDPEGPRTRAIQRMKPVRRATTRLPMTTHRSAACCVVSPA